MAEDSKDQGTIVTAKGALKRRSRGMQPWKEFLYRLVNPDKWSLKGRFLYLTGTMLVLGSVIQIGMLSYSLDQAIMTGARNNLRLFEGNLSDAIQARREFLLGQASIASASPSVIEALASGDRIKLLEFSRSHVDRLRLNLHVNSLNFRFYAPPGVAILQSANQGAPETDFSEDPLITHLFQTGGALSGLSLAARTPELKAVAPVLLKGTMVGGVSVSMAISEVFTEKTHPDANLVLLLKADATVKGATVDIGQGGGVSPPATLLARLSRYTGDRYGQWLVLQGYGERWRDSLRLLDQPEAQGPLDRLYGRLVLLKDSEGELFGAMLLAFDTTLLHESKQNRVYQLGGLFVSGAVLLWAILFFNTRRIELFLKRLKRMIIASHASDFSERFESDHVHCLEVMHCHNEECPVFMDPSRICYLETGSEAISPLWRDTCIFLNKYDSCLACPVYVMRKGDELAEMRNVVNTMMRLWKGFLSRTGHLLAYVLRSQETAGHIPSLDEVSKRLEQMAKLTFFGHDLQGTMDNTEVYQHLANVFRKDFHLDVFLLFEIDHDADSVTIALDESRDLPLCKHEVLLSVDSCRANRVAEDVSSFYNQVLCPYFNCDLGKYVRCCLPMVLGGHVGAVFSFLAPRNQWDTVRSETIPVLRKYLDATAPVLSSLKLLKLSKEQALRDPLTLCHNRRFLDEFISKYEPLSERENRRAGFLMADLDYFKQVNDEYGHEAGDQVLKQVVEIINNSIRRSDLLIRYGGEEFLVLLQDVQDGMAEQVAEKIRSRIEQHAFEIAPGVLIHKTISLGVAEYPEDGDTLYKVIKFSDVALYAAKNQGRNRVVRFKPEMWQDVEY